ncbi:hypothetical protein B0I35DRAFT_441908 [Stachybotrys elegans]|uniref:Uncharacterized protein n=1 Tax=Stachybotrys elegans TaxID=80388 RepID=A0A8K0WL01_9HYPO|nr:hypothetical protein B0I35DRAFT_441908 [Stachybotrys elegans]
MSTWQVVAGCFMQGGRPPAIHIIASHSPCPLKRKLNRPSANQDRYGEIAVLLIKQADTLTPHISRRQGRTLIDEPYMMERRLDPPMPELHDREAERDGQVQPDYNDPATLAALTGMAAPPTMSPEQLRAKAEGLSQNILANYDILQAILARHETVIQKRWGKKKKQQKLTILEESWPGMAKMHRPDFALWRRKSTGPQSSEEARSREKHFMCPYINQEDLLKPRTLLLLLNARGHHHPASFAGADCDAMHFGRVSQSLMPIFLNTYTMILNGPHDTYKYGEVVSWDEDEDAFTWYINGMQFMPGEGLLVLEAQDLVMDFLVTFCNKILHDIPPEILLTDAYPVEPEPLLKTEKEIDGSESMAIMALEAPYRVPVRLDFARVEAILRAQMESADDHIWQLREDPGYFIEQLHETMEHRQEMLKDTNGEAHPALSSRFQNTFWTRVLGNLISDAYVVFENFANLHKQALHLQQTHSSQLKQSVVASPPMRKFFVRTPPADPTSSKIHVRSKSGVKKDKSEGEVIWLLQTLWEDDHNLFLMRMPFVLDELERLLSNELRMKHLISTSIATQIGRLSTVGHCLRQLEMYQPWARGFQDALVSREGSLKEEFATITGPWVQLIKAMHERNPKLRQVAKMCESTEKFEYPSTKRRTRETTGVMIQAERNLDQLWDSIDRLLHEDAGGSEGMAVKQALSRPRSMHRTVEWVEPKPVPNDQQKLIDSDAELLYKPLSTLYFGHNEQNSGKLPDLSRDKITSTRTKAKKSTMMEAKLKETFVAASSTTSNPTAAIQFERIKVDARALKVFRVLFYNPAMTSTPGEISWKDFTYALTSTGKFTAEKLYGSVWQFSKIDGSDQSRIQFHEPHPHGKVSFVTARRHGRRLSRAYGWTGETFILK